LPNETPNVMRAPAAGLLSWAIPGMGHIYLGHRTRGIILLATITVTFWTGVAIGGVRNTVDPQEHRLWFTAQVCAGGHTLAAYAWHQQVTPPRPHGAPPSPPTGHWSSADIGTHYTGVAGLLSILIIIDAVARADSGRKPPDRRGGRKRKVPSP